MGGVTGWGWLVTTNRTRADVGVRGANPLFLTLDTFVWLEGPSHSAHPRLLLPYFLSPVMLSVASPALSSE